jgi:hypothetical protein
LDPETPAIALADGQAAAFQLLKVIGLILF